ncbi:MAG: hypothetical protein IKO35_04845 [Elusimicrobiaceae bacterium]|nr:hypothetical protein [Elusimicrobiaceae bacterium]
MGNDRLKALFKLLTTETETYSTVLRREIAAAIKQNPSAVKVALEEEFHSAPPSSILHVLEDIYWEDLSREFALFSAKINPDLEEGLALLSKFTDPALDRRSLANNLDQNALPLRHALLNATNYMEIARQLGRYFFGSLGLQTLSANTDIKDVSFSRFLQKRRGSSLCVACLYVLTGARYGLDINIIDLAGRVLLSLQDPSLQQAFFMDPLDNGKILWQSDCKQYLASRQIAWKDEFLAPLSSRQIVRRFLANMIFILNKIQDERRLACLRKYLEIIKN